MSEDFDVSKFQDMPEEDDLMGDLLGEGWETAQAPEMVNREAFVPKEIHLTVQKVVCRCGNAETEVFLMLADGKVARSYESYSDLARGLPFTIVPTEARVDYCPVCVIDYLKEELQCHEESNPAT